MATPPPSPQRAYRAACPNCGAPVDFRSAASASAVCSFCRSTLVRDGDALRRIGVSAELFDDFSPLQLGASGRYQGAAFTLVGRLQYRYDGGSWNEWWALFDSGKPGWLSEDNGAYVIAFDAQLIEPPPPATELQAGEQRRLAGQVWDVASVTPTRLITAQGELPQPPPPAEQEFTVVDLRNAAGEVGTLDYCNPRRVLWSIGRSVRLADLAMQGLRDGKGGTEKTLSSRSLACPNCGAALELKLATTQAITCHQCNAVVDVSQGVGGDLAHYAQNNSGAQGRGGEPQIPLGSVGQLALGPAQPLPWQVVGYVERCEIVADGEEQTFWREYLLYNQQEGFAFLVDADDGWSWVRPVTGAPQTRGDQAQWQSLTYRLRYRYTAKVTWVQGEFYWRVQRNERALVADYDGPTGPAGAGGVRPYATRKLSREQTGQEVTWSAGEALPAAAVATAFAMTGTDGVRLARDVAPVMPSGGGRRLGGLLPMLLIIAVMVVVALLMSRCGGDDCAQLAANFGDQSAEYQQCRRSNRAGISPGLGSGGGSFGGYSSGGGGHK